MLARSTWTVTMSIELRIHRPAGTPVGLTHRVSMSSTMHSPSSAALNCSCRPVSSALPNGTSKYRDAVVGQHRELRDAEEAVGGRLCGVVRPEIGVVVDPAGHVRDHGRHTGTGDVVGGHLVRHPVEGTRLFQLGEMPEASDSSAPSGRYPSGVPVDSDGRKNRNPKLTGHSLRG
jgi:hypothetical protein